MSKQVKNTVRIVIRVNDTKCNEIFVVSMVTYCIGTLIHCDNQSVFTSETEIEGLVVQT